MPLLIAGTHLGSHLGTLTIALVAIAAFLCGIHLLGRWAAATHPEPAPSSTAPAVVVPVVPAAPLQPLEIFASGVEGIPAETLAAISATVSIICGPNVRVARVEPARINTAPKQVSVENLMQQWSMEGRRQIYSSRNFR